MRRLLAALVLLASAAPAAAQEPERGSVVARHGDVELVAYDDRAGSLCVGLREGGDARSTSCSENAPSGRFEASLLSHQTETQSFVAGAVPAAGTAAVELEYAGGERIRGNVVGPGAYTGRHRDELAFFLVETTPVGAARRHEPVLLRRFDAGGTLIGATGGGGENEPLGEPVTLLRRSGLRVSVWATSWFSPTVIRFDRLSRAACIRIEHRRGSDGGSCVESGPAEQPMQVQSHSQCAVGSVLHGFVGPAIAAVEVTLGSGRRVRLAPRDVSVQGVPARAVAGLVRVGEAVRSARGLDATGRVLERQTIGAAPAPGRCARGDGGSSFGLGNFPEVGEPGPPRTPDGQQVAAGAAPGAQLVVRDEGEDHLCVGVDQLAANRRDCVVPSPHAFPVAYDVHATADRTGVGGVVPADVAGVRIELDGARKVTAALSEGGAYSGRYRGHVRFFLAELPGRHRVTLIETFDARGKLVTALPAWDVPAMALRTVARGRGLRLFGGRYDFRLKFPGDRLRRHRGSCFGLAFGTAKPSPADCESPRDAVLRGWVACAPRRGAMTGRLSRGLRGVQLTLAGGRTIASRTVRVPRSLGGGRLWLVEIPARARVTRLRFLGRRPRDRFEPRQRSEGAYPVAPATRQCGYALPEPTF